VTVTEIPGLDGYLWNNEPALTITVHGLPAAQGSKAYKGHRTSRKTGRRVAVLVEQSKAVKPWREKVTTAAAQAMILDHLGLQPIYQPVVTGAIRVDITFTMPKPTSAPKRRRTYPKTRPDIDKLQRAAFDGISDAGVWEDDGRVIEVTARKVYPAEHPAALDKPGAVIRLYTLTGAPQ
jgi:Holliday junction resolvase RusA-like endonuclease